MLFVDYSSEFNTIIPDILIRKLSDLGLYDQLAGHLPLSINGYLVKRVHVEEGSASSR